MKKLMYVFLFLISYILITSYSNAEENSNPGLSWHGYIQTDNRVNLKDENDEVEYSWQEYRLDLQAEAKPSEMSRFYSEVWLRSWSLPNVESSSDLSQKDKIAPLGFDFREAYVDIYGFLFDKLDIRAGRQRIAWGTGDKINPTDNLNPDDLEDIWDFGRHLGSDSIKASYYIGKFTVTGVFIPIFTPAVLPAGNWAEIFMPSNEGMDVLLASLPMGAIINMNNAVLMPENNPKKSSKSGAQISVNDIFGFNFSVSYVYGRDDLPIVKSVNAGMDGSSINISTSLFYPNMNIVGLDTAGSLFGIGVWAEGAMFIPEKVTMITDFTGVNPFIPVQESVVLDNNKPYYKYVVGLDYTFKTNTYINIQYFHGFVHERGRENLEDYLLVGIEQKLFNDKLKLTPIAGAVEIKDMKDIKNNYALVYVPEITFYPVDSAEVIIGAHIIDGKKSTIFGKAKDSDEVYLRIKYSF